MANERQPIVIPGSGRGGRDTTHRAPIPDGAKIGQFVCSSLLSGRDRERPDDPELQAKALFQKIREFMKEAGGTPDNIVQVTVYLTNESCLPCCGFLAQIDQVVPLAWIGGDIFLEVPRLANIGLPCY